MSQTEPWSDVAIKMAFLIPSAPKPSSLHQGYHNWTVGWKMGPLSKPAWEPAFSKEYRLKWPLKSSGPTFFMLIFTFCWPPSTLDIRSSATKPDFHSAVLESLFTADPIPLYGLPKKVTRATVLFRLRCRENHPTLGFMSSDQQNPFLGGTIYCFSIATHKITQHNTKTKHPRYNTFPKKINMWFQHFVKNVVFLFNF